MNWNKANRILDDVILDNAVVGQCYEGIHLPDSFDIYGIRNI